MAKCSMGGGKTKKYNSIVRVAFLEEVRGAGWGERGPGEQRGWLCALGRRAEWRWLGGETEGSRSLVTEPWKAGRADRTWMMRHGGWDFSSLALRCGQKSEQLCVVLNFVLFVLKQALVWSFLSSRLWAPTKLWEPVGPWLSVTSVFPRFPLTHSFCI